MGVDILYFICTENFLTYFDNHTIYLLFCMSLLKIASQNVVAGAMNIAYK